MREYENDRLRSMVRESYKALIVDEVEECCSTSEEETCCQPVEETCCSTSEASSSCQDEKKDTCCSEETVSSCCQDSSSKNEGEDTGEETSCCSGGLVFGQTDSIENISVSVGYSLEEIESVPEKSNFGLGCGNPVKEADIEPGDYILDLGSGAGFDSFLAANRLEGQGQVIGVDMTPEMISLARENASKGDYDNVSFRLGEIEYLPVESETIDLVISNCVINLSPDHKRVYEEIYRVLKPGAKICISDMVNVRELSDEIVDNKDMYCGCITGALEESELRKILEDLNFKNISIEPKAISREFEKRWGQDQSVGNYVMSAIIRAEK